MTQLLLLRHAKSEWDNPGLRDIDRPLAPRGQRAAADIARAISDSGLLPDRVLCSPATRTRETLAALRPYLGKENEVIFVDGLYESSPRDYLRAITQLGGDADTLMVIGHNPATQGTAMALAGAGEPAILADIAAKYPTGGLTVIAFDRDDWMGMTERSGRVTRFIKPRDLEAEPSGKDHQD
ncbi:SixA phosphatase family protein [Bauldia litoralis]|uniref:SixA phosphatase family protein n=1 Tax=Bauldia litoralis TaxID=665467 RepID=UPI003264D23D